MVMFTILTLIMIFIFCILPTLVLMTLGICIYYCLMEDPIPLSILLRYMLSPDLEDVAYQYPNFYPLTQQRPVIQSKLIIRKLLRVEEGTTTDNDDNDDNEYPRKHPFPIQVTTNHKCLHFSEPILFVQEEEEKDDDDDDDGEKETPVTIPHYQRPEEQASNAEEDAVDGEEIIMVDIEIGDASGDASDETPPSVIPSSPEYDNDNLPDEEIVIPMGGADAADDVANDNNKGSEDDPEKQQPLPTTDSEENVLPPVVVTTTTTMDDDDDDTTHDDYFGINDEWRDRGTACDICLLEYQVGDAVAWSPNLECSHSYHKDCVLDWLVRKPTCPNCRHDYLKGKGDGAEEQQV
jgi:hypothetical protein